MARIINLGSLNIDFVYAMPHILREGETLTSTARSVNVGGKGLNQSVAMSRAGLPVLHAGTVGADGLRLVDFLNDEGISTDFVRVMAEKDSGHTIIQVTPEGQNAILYFPGTNAMITDDFLSEVIDAVGEDDLLVLQNEVAKTRKALKMAQEAGIRVLYNPSPFDPSITADLVNGVYALIVNETEGAALLNRRTDEMTDDELFDALCQKFPNPVIILTLGDRGSRAHVPGASPIQVEAKKVEAHDTTGAGDTFTGFVCRSLFPHYASKADFHDALELEMNRATLAASIAVTREGAAKSIPTLSEVLQAESV